MNFETVEYRVGAWALNYLIYDDLSGLDDWERQAVTEWTGYSTNDWTDADGNVWVFAHWSTGEFDDFARDDITGLMGSTVKVTGHYALATKAPLELA